MVSNERPVILVVVTFFLALVLVYVVYARVRVEKQDADTVVTWSGSQFASIDLTEGDESQYNSGSDSMTTGVIALELSPMEQKIRSMQDKGIKPWYSSIKVADLLGLSVQFAFADGTGIHYGYLGTGWVLNELATTVRQMWWNVLEIATKNSIMDNLLRWDRILFVNIPNTTFVQQGSKEQRLLVAMIVQIGDDRRFIQAPIDLYYAHKPDMKAYFEFLYDKAL